MEVNNPHAWLDTDHPNYTRWERGRNLSFERGEFVRKLVFSEIELSGLIILDIGSGEGGTSFVLSQTNFVISADSSILRLERQRKSFHNDHYHLLQADARLLPFSDKSFDLIIIQDVIEHINASQMVISEMYRVLKSDGMIYLSTPNRFSIFNIISDPHWGIPFLSIFSRGIIKNYFLRLFRKNDFNRTDIPELISLNALNKKLKDKFEFKLLTKKVVEELLKGNKGIVWSNFHLSIIKMLTSLNLNRFLLRVANDTPGLINKYFTPTFYLLLRKRKIKLDLNSESNDLF